MTNKQKRKEKGSKYYYLVSIPFVMTSKDTLQGL